MIRRKLDDNIYKLLIANLISNCAIFYTLHSFQFILFTVCISSLLTLFEYLLGFILPQKIRKPYYITVLIFYILVIVVEYYVILVFKYNITEDLVFILLDTNKGEIDGFFSAYAKPVPLLIFVVSTLAVAAGIFLGGKVCMKLVGEKLWLPVVILSIIGVACYAYIGYSYIRLDDGMHATQYTTMTRILGATAKVNHRKNVIKSLRNVCRNVEAWDESSDSLNIIVVIGESFSRYHSSLYGYQLKTNPLLEKRVEDGSMIVFSDVISRADATHEALRSIFSTDSLGLGFGGAPLFPAIFRKAGYKSYLWDNQYLVGNGISFMADDVLSDIMYDKRNSESFWTDAPFLETMPDVSEFKRTLFVIHLAGQHFYYKDRYDRSFQYFKPSDYPAGYTETQREVLAEYDNATLYNDVILDRIIEMFSKTKTVLVYFTDHGEELYENGDFYGHTNALKSKDLRFQIQSPFVVWMSASFRGDYPDIYERMQEVKDYPMITDDVSQLLLDIAGIKTATYSPYRDILNPAYNKNRDRMILNSFNYDEWIRSRNSL